MLQARDDQFCGHGHLAAEVLSRRMGPRKKQQQKKLGGGFKYCGPTAGPRAT